MLILAALLAASQAAPAQDREMLDSLKAACDRAGDVATMTADAASAGWQAIADDADPRIAKLHKMGREAVDPEMKMSGASFRRTLGGRELFLILSRAEDPSGVWGAGCRLYDFAAEAPVDPALLQGWIGKPPTGASSPSPGLSRLSWEPAWRDGITFEASHVPADHEIGKTYGLSGNILVVQAIGGF